MIPDIRELNFPQYATLSTATISLNDMGERVITTQVKIDGDIKPDFSYNWEIEFMGERYIHSLRSPQALKDNSSICSKIDLTFQHWVIYELKRHYFVELTSVNARTAIPDKYIASLGLSITDFVTAFQNVLDYYYRGAIKIQLNPAVEYSQERAFMNISYSYIWDVLQEFYNVYGVRWHIGGDTIYIGYPVDNITHIFEYGYENGLISIERQVQDTNIRNILLGRGGSTNLPQYYFKNAPEDSLYASDPDAIPELEYVFFTELRDKTFRDYIQGWKTNANRDTKNNTIAIESYDEERGQIDFAYRKGHEDEIFDPIEYVKDDSSIAKYGELQGGLDNNEEIYPSIQNISIEGIGLVNEVIAVESVISDDVDQAVTNESIISTTPDIVQTKTVAPQSKSTIHIEHDFIVDDGLRGSLFFDTALRATKFGSEIPVGEKHPDNPWWLEISKDITISIHNLITDTYHNSGLNLPTGYYIMTVQCEVFNPYSSADIEAPIYGPAFATLSLSNIKLIQSKFSNSNEEWKPTFDIWIKNIWQTEKLTTETEQEYADRVWLPIFGDEGKEAMVTFSSGWLSSSENWEFMVVKGGYAYDTSKSYNGVPSHWKLTLQKSDAELKATNKYIPNVGMQAVAGDTFFFTGIDMQHQYVLFAEQRVKEWKIDNLDQTKDIKPTWVAKLDKVRINQLEGNETLLVNKIQAGALINIKDKRFIDGVLTLYIQSVTFNYTNKLIADVDIFLSDKITSVLNPVQKLQGDIDTLSVKIANQNTELLNMVRQMCDAIYLRKDGVADLSKSPTSFNALVKSGDFRGGIAGGQGWGIFRDSNGNSVAEFDHIRARASIVTNEFIRNTTKYQGGTQIYSAAEIEISRVVENENDYECYFDQKGGSVTNLFAIDDIAYSQLFNSQNNTIKFYKRRVVEVGVDYIKLSKADQYGEGVPTEKDIVIHFGNYTDVSRQYVIVRDIIGGGYDRMISNLNSVSAMGNEYYFAGRENGNTPRWFVGDVEGDYAEWRDGQMSVKGDFILRNSGKNVETMFSITEDGIKSTAESLQAEAIKGKTLLYNATFTRGLDGWVTSDSKLSFISSSLLLSSGNAVTNTVYVSGTPIFDNVYCLTINNGWIKQSNALFVNKPQFDEKEQYPLFFSANIRCKAQGTLIVKVGENEIYNAIVESSEKFVSIDIDGNTWNGQGDFYLSFSGEADFYGLTIYTSKTEVRHKTFFMQSDKLIGFATQQLNTDGSIRQGSEVVATEEGVNINVVYTDSDNTKHERTLGSFGIVNGNETKVVLSGDNIQLKGDLTVDGKFKVREDGSIEATNGTFSGYLINKPLKVTEDNYSEFFNIEEDTHETWNWKGWLLCSCVMLKYTSAMKNSSSSITRMALPSIDARNIAISEDELDTIRSFIGQSITVYNSNNTDKTRVQYYNRANQQIEREMGANTFASFVCKVALDLNDNEFIYWEEQVYGTIKQLNNNSI